MDSTDLHANVRSVTCFDHSFGGGGHSGKGGGFGMVTLYRIGSMYGIIYLHLPSVFKVTCEVDPQKQTVLST